jgi:pyruvate,water dikinase
MMLYKLTTKTHFSINEIGGKGYNLQKLISWGIRVPETHIIPADEMRTLSDNEAHSSIVFPKQSNKNNLRLAVRSSGIGEDGNENSFAGIFNTLLYVKPAELSEALHKVYSSKNTSVTSMYSDARDVKVVDMAVIVQEMIDADFAGVAFSVNPIEQDRKVGLLEIVRGVGESLVSGKIKPTSLRINRITGMHRILQKGTDAIQPEQLEQIIALVSEALWQIDELYKKPVDIEWAMKSGMLYLLQARPITTLGELK